jgi:Holliday junction resolvase
LTNIRRQRGYAWEVRLQDYFNELDPIKREYSQHIPKTEFWNAARLAPSNTSMPDVVVTYKNKLFGLEAKSTAAKVRSVRLEQIDNASKIIRTFPLYDHSYVGTAWYFMRKTKHKFDGEITEQNRKIRIYLAIWENEVFRDFVDHYPKYNKVKMIDCNYQGTIRYRTIGTLRKFANVTDILDESDLNTEIKEKYPYEKFFSLEKFVTRYQQNTNNNNNGDKRVTIMDYTAT